MISEERIRNCNSAYLFTNPLSLALAQRKYHLTSPEGAFSSETSLREGLGGKMDYSSSTPGCGPISFYGSKKTMLESLRKYFFQGVFLK